MMFAEAQNQKSQLLHTDLTGCKAALNAGKSKGIRLLSLKTYANFLNN